MFPQPFTLLSSLESARSTFLRPSNNQVNSISEMYRSPHGASVSGNGGPPFGAANHQSHEALRPQLWNPHGAPGDPAYSFHFPGAFTSSHFGVDLGKLHGKPDTHS